MRAAGPRRGSKTTRGGPALGVRWALMRGLLAAALAIALAAGCSFHAPDASQAPLMDGAAPAPDGATTPPDGAAARCVGYDTNYNGHKYRLSQSGMTWDEAKASCDSGGYLLKIESPNEDIQASVLLVLYASEVWLGLRDVNQSGVYVWTDGTAPSFTHWSGPAPTIDDPDCIVKIVSIQNDARWYARSCTDMRRAVCECVP